MAKSTFKLGTLNMISVLPMFFPYIFQYLYLKRKVLNTKFFGRFVAEISNKKPF